MTKKWMAVLTLALMAPAVFGQTVVTAAANPAEGQVKMLREEIKRDKQDLTAKVKAARSARQELNAQMKAEFEKVKNSTGTRAEKSSARKALRQKYARLMKDVHAKSVLQRRSLREDMSSKSGLIKKLRQS